MTTVSARVAHAISAHCPEIFGLMGNGNAHFLDALVRLGITHFTAIRHEAAAVASADAYVRAGGRLGVATTTYGAGFTNTLTALTEAVQARTPLLLVVGDAPGSGPRPWDIDQRTITDTIGAPTFVVARDDAAAVTVAAMSHALAHRTPVILAIPYDLASALSHDTGEIPAIAEPARVPVNRAQLAPAIEALAGARRPAIIAGRGAWIAGAADALSDLAADLGAVTSTSALGRGLFREAEFDLGVTGGFGQENAMAVIAEADVVLVVGAGMNQFTMAFGHLINGGTTVIRVDDTVPHAPGRTDLLVLGDALLTVTAIRDGLRERAVVATGWRETVLTRGTDLHGRDAGEGVCLDGLLDPRSVAAALADILPENRVVVSDGGHFIGWANTYWPVARPDRMIMVGTAFQSIGLGFASAPGAARAVPEATVVVTTGDGGGLMAIADLESTIRSATSSIIVVWNDAAYGAEVHLYGKMGLAESPMLIPTVNFAGIAAALGARSQVVTSLDDLDDLRAWVAAGAQGSYLVDCRVSQSVAAPYQEEILAVNLAGAAAQAEREAELLPTV